MTSSASFLLLVVCIVTVSGKRFGPPSSVCGSMIPSHPGNPQSGQSPYSVELSKNTYTPGETVTVMLKGTSTFKGFLIQPRKADGSSEDTFGTFNSPSNTKNPCAALQKTALSHSDNTPKSEVTMEWTPPAQSQGDINFFFTVVQAYETYWVKQESATLTYVAPTGATVAVTSQQPSTAETINRDSGCESTLGCFPASDSCTTNCDYLITWKSLGAEVEFTIKRKAPIPNYYVAIGFSSDIKMGDDSVVDCIADQGDVKTQSSFNTFSGVKANGVLTPANHGLSSVTGSLVDGILTCKFRRKKKTAENADKFYDLSSSWYLFVASGVVDNGVKEEHSWKTISPTKIDFTAITKPAGTTPQPQTGGTINRDSGCESTLGCFPASDSCTTNCDYLITWKSLGAEVEFTIKRKAPIPNYYVAIGFSSDIKMGDDSVVDCIADQGDVKTQSSFNTFSGVKANGVLTPANHGLSSVTGSLVDGILTCKFRRKKKTAENADTFYDLSSSWYLFVASGVVDNGVKEEHSWKTISPTKIDFTAITKPAGTTPQPQTGGTINRDSGCESTLGCFPASDSCTTNCDYLITWKSLGAEVEFTIKRKAPIPNYYVAIGFSSDIKMGDDSVVDCIADQGDVKSQSSFNTFSGVRANGVLTPANHGLSSVTGSVVDGILTCNLRRKKKSTDNADKFYDLSSSWYLFVASGVVDNGEKDQHSWLTISPTKIDFTAITKPAGTTPQPQAGGTLKKSAECGDTRGCFTDCKGGTCGFQLTWQDLGNQESEIAMTISCKKAASGFCAIGLSSDKEMGDDSVMACISNNGVVTVAASYNINNGKGNKALSDDMFGLSIVSSSHEDGVLTCSFLRKKTAALASAGSVRRKRAATADGSTFFDVNSAWNLFFAEGPQIGGQVIKHDKFPVVSTKKADFQSTEDIGGESGRHDMVKAHGILMSIAWLFCATIGLFMARFYKDAWPEGREACGQKRWFQSHRTLMITAFLATAAAFVIIFVHEKEWVDIDGSTFEKSHPIIGTVVMGLALINPIMAFFRPHPGTKRRPLFRFAHTLVGYGALILGIINIFSGTLLSSSNLPDYIRYILYGFVGWTFLIDIILHIYICTKQSQGGRGESYEMHGGGSGADLKEGKGVDQVKICILVLHVIVVLGAAVAVAVVIGVAEGNKP